MTPQERIACAWRTFVTALMGLVKPTRGEGFKVKKGTPSSSRRAFAIFAALVMVFATFTGVLTYWLTINPGKNQGPIRGGGGSMATIPGWEPWYFYADGMVNTGSGNLYLSFNDIKVRARGHTLEVVRAYNGQSSSMDSDFGYGWTWNYGTTLDEAPSGDVTWYDGDGSQHLYTYNTSTSKYDPPTGIHSKLTKDSGNFTLWHLDGSRWFFVNGLPDTWTDKNGNNLTFTWKDPTPALGPELEKVEDDSGLNLTFTYSSGRITGVQDPIGRSISYAYDRPGNLDTVTDALTNTDTFDYDTSHVMTRWIDRVGVLYEFDHNTNDRLTDLDISIYDAITDGPLSGSTIEKMNLTYVNINDEFYTNITNDRGYTGLVKSDDAGLPKLIETPVSCACGALSVCMRLTYVMPGNSGCGCTGGQNQGGCGGASSCPLTGVNYSLTWDKDNNLVSFEDALGNLFSYDFNDYGQVETHTDPLGNATTWSWIVTDSGTSFISLLSNYTNARGYTWDFEYNSYGNLINTTDPTGNYSTQDYDAYGHMTSDTDYRGNTWTYVSDTHGYLLNVTDPTNNVTKNGWDNVGRMTNTTNARGFTTSYGWDDGDRLLNVTDATGNMTEYTYNARGDRLSVKNALSHVTTFSWNLTIGKITSITDARGNTTYSYHDGEGNIVELKNARGYSTTYSYDSSNRLLNITDASGNITSLEYDDAGRISKVTDRRGFDTKYGYDGLGQRVNTTDALGNTTYIKYDEIGNIVNFTNARGYSTLNTYDALNRLTQMEDALGGTILFTYDANGNLVEIEDSNGNSITHNYDALNRKISVTDALNYSVSYSYNEVGSITTIKDANSNIIKYYYDQLDRVINLTDTLANTIQIKYDAIANIVNITNAKNYTTGQKWDELRRLIEVSTPLGNKTKYEYDEVGNLVNKTDAKDQTVQYTYDQLNLLTRIDYPDGSNVTTDYNENGYIVYEVGWNFSRTVQYDSLNRVSEIEFDLNPFNKTIKYSYDENGNRVKMTDGENGETTYEWNELDQLISMTSPDNLKWQFTYDATGRRIKIIYPDGMYTNYTYNNVSWITKVESKAANHTIFESFEYGYDSVGNRVNITYGNGSTVEFGYDDIYQLLSENYSWGLTINFTYDGNGNRLSEMRDGAMTNYTYDADDHLLSQGNVTFEWDNNGNLVKKIEWNGNTTYEWDYENRLTNITLSNNTALEFEYDAKGRRISESISGNKTYLFYDYIGLAGDFEDLIAEYNQTGTRIAAFVHGPGADEPLAVKRGGSTKYYIHDALGSTTGLGTTNGISSSLRYEAFGNLHPDSDQPDRYGFTSREFNKASSLYSLRARWYEPKIGRFISRDPAGFVDGLNLYTYVNNNPVNIVDPSGLGDDCQYLLGFACGVAGGAACAAACAVWWWLFGFGPWGYPICMGVCAFGWGIMCVLLVMWVCVITTGWVDIICSGVCAALCSLAFLLVQGWLGQCLGLVACPIGCIIMCSLIRY